MKDLQIFNNSKFGEIRVAKTENNEPLFCLADVCTILSLRQGDVRQRLDEGVVSTQPLQTAGGIQQVNFVNEDGLYDVILDSRKLEARQFRKWVTSEVLPGIRKHGAYMNASVIEKALTDPDTLIQLATNLKEERRQREMLQERSRLQENVIKTNAPKVDYFNEVLQSQSTYTTTQIAKELGMAAPTLNKKLHEMRVQYKQSDTWLLYEKYQNKGFTKTKTHVYYDNNEQKTAMQTVWTEQGRLFIHSLFKIRTNGASNQIFTATH